MRKIEIIKWEQYWLLTIIKEWVQIWAHRSVICKCECWKQKEIRLNSIRNWKSKSCWCIQKQNFHNKKHWKSTTRIYRIWIWMIQRCTNTSYKRYKDYWGRWIKVCDRWLESFENFYEDMEEWYQDHLTIDRKENDWNYCKSNCKWSTKKEQANNTRQNIMYKWKCLMQWCNILNLNYKMINNRISAGWTIEDALYIPKITTGNKHNPGTNLLVNFK